MSDLMLGPGLALVSAESRGLARSASKRLVDAVLNASVRGRLRLGDGWFWTSCATLGLHNFEEELAVSGAGSVMLGPARASVETGMALEVF